MCAEVVVLGCGPAGLIAATTVERMGHTARILSRKVKSQMPGAIYIHNPIPGVTADMPHAHLTYIKLGSQKGYAAKVYGSPDAPCSWRLFPEGKLPAWDMRAAYDRLWERYEDRIEEWDARPDLVDLLLKRRAVISTIPATTLCEGDHVFESAHIWVRRSWPASMPQLSTDPIIVYNGDPTFGWYRASSIFGYQSTEFGHQVIRAEPGYKPVTSNCDCHHPHLIRAGRFGSWTKGVLLSDVPKQVQEALA